jgi:thiamine pyrophosphate-dependent acetolactate synthase large subunit-like protein
MLTKDEFLRPLVAARPADAVVVTCMGVVRPWGRLSRSPLDLASADSAMGHAADLALGIAIARPERRVICLNGDGSMLMSLGTLATVVESGVRNLVLVVVQNDSYEVTGNQRVPAAGRLDWPAIARGAGISRARAFDDPARWAAELPDLLRGDGPVFAAVRVEPGAERPLARGAGAEEEYLRTSLAESARRLREALGA